MRSIGLLTVFILFATAVAHQTAAQEATAEAAEEAAVQVEEAVDETAPAAESAVEAIEEPADAEEPVADEEADASEDSGEEAVEEVVEEETGPGFFELVQGLPPLLALLHHAAVHMPIALWLLGAFFVFVGVFVPSWRNQIPLACLIGGALTSVAAAATGWWYSDHENGDGWAWADGVDWSIQLDQHRWLGVTLAVVSLILSVIALISQNKQSKGLGFIWRVGLLGLAAAVAWEGHIGGELIMGEGFFEEAVEAWLSGE